VLSSSDIGEGIAARHMAMPKLMGAPAYARPKRLVEETVRPFDPDDLPLEAVRTEEERYIAAAVTEDGHAAHDVSHMLRPSDSSGLRAIASRLLRPRG
jgi:hypothetical protein